jgi:hypothetical protein
VTPFAAAVDAIRAGRCPACGGALVSGVRFAACACGQEWLVFEDACRPAIAQPGALWLCGALGPHGYRVVELEGGGIGVLGIVGLPDWLRERVTA